MLQTQQLLASDLGKVHRDPLELLTRQISKIKQGITANAQLMYARINPFDVMKTDSAQCLLFQKMRVAADRDQRLAQVMRNGVGQKFQVLGLSFQLGGPAGDFGLQVNVELNDFLMGLVAFGDVPHHHHKPVGHATLGGLAAITDLTDFTNLTHQRRY